LAKVGIKLITGVDVLLGDFDVEIPWMYFKKAFHVEPWRQLMVSQDSLNEWYKQKESNISISFKKR